MQFENFILKRMWKQFKEKWKEFKGLIDKLFKAINVVLDSLKKAFPKLHIVKESKDLLKNLIEDDDSATQSGTKMGVKEK